MSTRLTAGELADIHRNALGEYENACGFVIGLRERPDFPGDPFAKDTRQRVTRLAQEIADTLEWRLEQVVDLAQSIAEQEKAERVAHYSEQARLAKEQEHRRHRYDNHVSVADVAEGIAEKAAREHAPGHPFGVQPGPGGLYARFCKVDGCDWRDIVKAAS